MAKCPLQTKCTHVRLILLSFLTKFHLSHSPFNGSQFLYTKLLLSLFDSHYTLSQMPSSGNGNDNENLRPPRVLSSRLL